MKRAQLVRLYLLLLALMMSSVLLSRWLASRETATITTHPNGFDLVAFSLQTSWPLTPPTVEPVMGERPLLPKSPASAQLHLPYLEHPGNKGSAIHVALEERWRYLIMHHPDKTLSQAFRLVWSERQLGVSFNVNPSAESAAFRVSTGGPNPDFPYVELSAHELLRAETTTDYLDLMISISHEWVHYQQWLDSSFLEREVFSNHPPVVLPKEQYCRLWWDQEQQALSKACRYAIEWNILSAGRITCRYSYTVTEFDHANFMLVLARGSKVTGPMQLCKALWAKQVGHPHPEEFD